MLKTKIFTSGILLTALISSCDTVQQVASQRPATGTGSTATTPSSGTITESQANAGIKQALHNGLQESIRVLSTQDGFWGDQAVRILMPEEAHRVESALRSVGLGNLCDQFLLSMNRAAETAVSEASSVFINSLSRMTVNDAFNILLSGQQDAATQFFRTSTTEELTSRFSPIINDAMGQNNVASHWTQLTNAYNQLPLGNKIETDLTAYITSKAIDGLFVKVGEQELKIRQNIGGSRDTAILQQVFGWADRQK